MEQVHAKRKKSVLLFIALSSRYPSLSYGREQMRLVKSRAPLHCTCVIRFCPPVGPSQFRIIRPNDTLIASLTICGSPNRPPTYLPALMHVMSQIAPLTSILLALGIAANPIVVRNSLVSLSFARHLNITGSNDLVLRDQTRAKHLVSLSKAKLSDNLSADAIIGLNVINAAATYQTSVDIGSPANSCESQ